jgi:DNA repair photolyase
MRIIYEPQGKAREYSPLAINIYRGCEHGCIYCWAPDFTRIDRKSFVENVSPRKELLAKLEQDAKELRGDPRQILLSFTSDPYQPIEVKLGLTRQVIEILLKYDLTFTILTKGGKRALRDFDLLKQGKASFGTTLCFTNDQDRKIWEPNAAPVEERLEVIEEAHSRGIPTWVSVEPVIYPEQAISLIYNYHDIVDFWKVGKLNYHPHEKTIDWKKFKLDVINALEEVGAKYYIKKDLQQF